MSEMQDNDLRGDRNPSRAGFRMDSRRAEGLESLFKVLSCATRLRILHALTQTPGLCAGEISELLSMKPQAVSNQLKLLSALGILGFRRDGQRIRYRILDPCVVDLLDRGLCLLGDLAPATQEKVFGFGEE